MVVSAVVVSLGIFAYLLSSGQKGSNLTKEEMKNIWAGRTCGNMFPCKKSSHYCRIACTPVGSSCESCIGSGLHYICSNEGPFGSTCTPGIEEEGCGQRYKGHCVFPRTCYQEEYLDEWCDRENATGTSCPTL